MDHYDFESSITDADFDFTLDDILNEFHSGGTSSALDEAQPVAVSDTHADFSQQNNNPVYGPGIEGASTINTNEFEESVINGSDLTTADVSGEPVMRNARTNARRRSAASRHCWSECNQAPRPGRLPAASTVTA